MQNRNFLPLFFVLLSVVTEQALAVYAGDLDHLNKRPIMIRSAELCKLIDINANEGDVNKSAQEFKAELESQNGGSSTGLKRMIVVAEKYVAAKDREGTGYTNIVVLLPPYKFGSPIFKNDSNLKVCFTVVGSISK